MRSVWGKAGWTLTTTQVKWGQVVVNLHWADLSFCPEAPVPVAAGQQPGAWDELKGALPIVRGESVHQPVLLCQAQDARNAIHPLTWIYLCQSSLTVLQIEQCSEAQPALSESNWGGAANSINCSTTSTCKTAVARRDKM